MQIDRRSPVNVAHRSIERVELKKELLDRAAVKAGGAKALPSAAVVLRDPALEAVARTRAQQHFRGEDLAPFSDRDDLILLGRQTMHDVLICSNEKP